jgi:hypothetical protein
MGPFVRVIGKVLRLVGISSPEDTLTRPASASDPPSWRTPKPVPQKPEDSQDGSSSNDKMFGNMAQ